MWHVGIHVWEVPWNEQEPNYDEYYAVRLLKCFEVILLLTVTGQSSLQSPQPTDFTPRQSLHHPSSSTSRFSHRVAEARTLRYSSIHHRKRFDSMVPLHFRLSTTNRQHLEAPNVWQSSLHGPPQDGRNAPLGDVRQPLYRPFDSPDPLHYRAKDDECATQIATCSACGLHLQFGSDSYWCREDLPNLPRPTILSLQAGLDVSDRLLHQPH